jgi:hypothetical protein
MFTQILIFNRIFFQHKHKKVNSIFIKKLIMEASMLTLNFDELSAKFEKL